MASSRTTTVLSLAAAALLLTAGAGALPAQVAPPRASADTRIAFINSQTILQQMPGYAAAESTLNKDLKSYQDEIQSLQVKFDSAQRDYDQKEVVLSPSAKQAKQQELRQLQQRSQQRAQELQTRAQGRERELMQPLEDRVKGVIEGLRAERNLAFIFDVAAPGNGIVAADKSLDLTLLVVQRLKGSQ